MVGWIVWEKGGKCGRDGLVGGRDFRRGGILKTCVGGGEGKRGWRGEGNFPDSFPFLGFPCGFAQMGGSQDFQSWSLFRERRGGLKGKRGRVRAGRNGGWWERGIFLRWYSWLQGNRLGICGE